MKRIIYVVLALLAFANLIVNLVMLMFGELYLETWLSYQILHLTGRELSPFVFFAFYSTVLGLLVYVFYVLSCNERYKEKQAKIQIEMKNEAIKFSLKTWRVARAVLSLNGGDLHSIVLLERRNGQCEILHVVEGHKYFNSFAFLKEGDEVLFEYGPDSQAENLLTFPSNYLIPTVVGSDSSGK